MRPARRARETAVGDVRPYDAAVLINEREGFGSHIQEVLGGACQALGDHLRRGT